MEKDISSIHDDFKYQKIEWPLARIFWLLVMLVLAFGLIGGLGDSSDILNRTSVSVSDAVVEYDKYLRIEKQFTTKVLFRHATGHINIGFNKDYFDKIVLTDVIPQPDKVEVRENKIIYMFTASGNGTITFFGDPLKNGRQDLELYINNRKIKVSQLTYF